MSTIQFCEDLIKGKIAEVIFEQMFRESERFTILHFGYEYTLPELAQYQHLTEVKAVMKNIKDAPDFILISQDKKKVYLVEVKYRCHPKPDDNLEMAKSLLKRWNPSWLFIASPKGFFFEPCNDIVTNKGKIGTLYPKWATDKIQKEYLNILRKYEVGCRT